MGSRSDFKRIERDYYRSIDPRIGRAVAPHLPAGVRYIEPCAGAGDLIEQLRPHATCVGAYDIEPQAEWIARADMFDLQIGDADMWIANPPWSRPILHKLIVHLSDQAPALCIFDSNWANTKQAARFMERCRKIISIGRVIWIPNTKVTGKDDISAYLFDKPIPGSAPIFYGRGCLPAEQRRARRICADCGEVIDRFGKWRLVERQGKATPSHWNCERPSDPFGDQQLAPCPLLDWPGYAVE